MGNKDKLVISNLYKTYNSKDFSVEDVSINVKEKEFIVLVGPSGCGKTTILRMIAGLEKITKGDIFIDGILVNDIQPKDRNLSMVFQNYALYPHMNVFKNIAIPLETRKVKKNIVKQKVEEISQMLGLEAYLKRYPRQLSGGQRQRVAIGRAIAREPSLFLMDEPLSNLDAKLRVKMRSEIVKLHKRIGATTIYVTHDQVEAMTMADRIVVMHKGKIQQIGTPKELYENPKNLFVAGFIGNPQMNFIEGEISNNRVMVNGEYLNLNGKNSTLKEKEKIILGIRPNHIEILNERLDNCFEISIVHVEYLGSHYAIQFLVNGTIVSATVSPEVLEKNTRFYGRFNLQRIYLFNKESGERI